MFPAVLLCSFLFAAAQSQPAPQQFTDAAALLTAVAKTYAADAHSFHFEAISERSHNGEFRRDWEKSIDTVIKGPDNRFRIEARTGWGQWLQDSDGKTEWVYVREAKDYVKRPAGNGPQFPKVIGMGTAEIRSAWQMRTYLEAKAERAKQATLLADQTLVLEGTSYPCYVVHAITEQKDFHSDLTFWIEKKTLMFRKIVEHNHVMMELNAILSIPWPEDITTVYPVADVDVKTAPELFAFTPPADAKEVATLEPQVSGFEIPPPPQLAGKPAPDVALTGSDGKEVKLSSFRGHPVLIDVWATWCGPCLEWMPAFGRLEAEMRRKGVRVISVDQDHAAEDATRYLSVHGFTWPNYHDPDGKLAKAFGDKAIPLTVLIDANGQIAYASIGSEQEAELRKAIAALTPEVAASK